MQKKSQRRTGQSVTELFIEHGKIPPQAIDIEEVVLGVMLIEYGCIPVVMGLIGDETFYKEAHRLIFGACKVLYDKSQPVDILTVTEKLRELGELDVVGGPYYITMLTNRVSSGVNVETHCRILLEKQIKRAVIRAASESMVMAYDDTWDAFDCVSVLDQSVVNINEISASGGNLVSLDRLLPKVEEMVRKREQQYKSGRCTGIPTGLHDLDKRTAGWQNGDLVVLAGRPSMGKTALMLHHALSSGVNVCIYSLEMPNVSLVDRMILSMSELDANRYRAGAMDSDDWAAFEQARKRLAGLPIYIDDNPVVTTRYIKSHSKMMKDKGKCDIVMVDYLQLADMRTEQRGRNREQEVSQAAREFKIMAKTLNVPVLLLSQLSRESEKRGDKKPMLSDLRESGAIEQDADIVLFAYRPAYYGLLDKYGNDQQGIGYEIIAKGRNIGIGEVAFRHNESMSKIYDYNYRAQVEGVPF